MVAFTALIMVIWFLLLQAVITLAYTDPQDVSSLQDILKSWQGELVSNWTGSDPCASQWQGIACIDGAVTSLYLDGKGIRGTLPGAIGGLKNLRTLYLQKNELFGVVPEQIGNLTSLTALKLSANHFSGSLPGSINRLSSLEVLSLRDNSFTGPLPDISNLTQLTDIFLQNNGFNGTIPDVFATFKQLRTLQLSVNEFTGPVPASISQLSQLSTLYIDHNLLNGPFPNISGLRSLQYLWVQNNELSGPIPADIGFLSSLQNFGLENNHFNGSIPFSLMQLSNLPYLFLQNNNLSGAVPDLSGLINLQGMSFTNNSFNLVQIPRWIFSMQNLQLLFLDNCDLEGVFPEDIFRLHALTTGRFDNNKFNGTLDITRVGRNLTLLSLENNHIKKLTGEVPYKFQLLLGGNPLCDDTSFLLPDLCEMAEAGRGPTSWTLRLQCPSTNCTLDQVMDPTACTCVYALATTFGLSSPPFSSITAARVGALERKLVDTIKLKPDQVKIISASFTNKTEITVTAQFYPSNKKWQRLRLSAIQRELKKQNLLAGNGVYSLVSVSLPKGMIEKEFWNSTRILSIVLPVCLFLLCSGITVFLWQKHQAKKRTLKYGVQQELAKHSLQPAFFTYNDLKFATRDFDPSNKLGEGSFGEVFKGTLSDSFHVAVKRLFPSRIQQGCQEFVNEVTIITGVMHRNLVKLIGCCVEENERILVYEYVENNSVYHALFELNLLDWKQRFEIAIGTARGIAYLHEDCQTRIIHRDIKASNILLDKNMNPKIADFGLARFFPDGASHVSTRVAGTFGYVAPEYGLYGQLTEKADTFSFGVVLLELLSGRKSITLREEVVLLLDWAWKLYEENSISELVDPRLKGDYSEDEFKRLVAVALLCTQASPGKRPRMSHVVRMLLGERKTESPGTPGIISEIVDNSISESSL